MNRWSEGALGERPTGSAGASVASAGGRAGRATLPFTVYVDEQVADKEKVLCEFGGLSFLLVIPVTMETRCSKVIFPNCSKKKPAEDTLVPPLWGTREKNVFFSRIICSRCCTRQNLRFHVENCQHADQKQLTRR